MEIDRLPDPRVVTYVRVSTSRQDVESQEQSIRRWLELRGWEPTQRYADEAISGRQERRPGLDQLLEAVRSRKVDVVVIARLDRLGRSLRHLLQLIEELHFHEVRLVSVADPMLNGTSSASKLMFQLLGAFSEFEANLIRERTVAGMERARRQGKHVGRPRRRVDLRAAKILLDQGHSLRQVAEMLDIPRSTLSRRLREAREGGPEGSLHGDP